MSILSYDFGDLSYLFSDLAGSILAEVNGPVGFVMDLEGSYNLVAPSLLARPILRRNGCEYFLEFNGINQTLCCPNVALSSDMHLFVKARQRKNTKPLIIEHGPNANISNGFYFYGNNYAPWRVMRNGIGHHGLGVANWTGNQVALFELHYNSSENRYQRNCVDVSNGVIVGVKQPTSLVTDTLWIGSRNGATMFSEIDLYGLRLYSDETFSLPDARLGLADRVVLLGDSIIAGSPSVASFINVPAIVDSLAVPGHGFLEQRTEWLNYAFKDQVSDVVVLVGANNLGVSLADMVAKFEFLIESIAVNSPFARIHVMTLLPQTQRLLTTFGAGACEDWKAFNHYINAEFPSTGIHSHSDALNDGTDNIKLEFRLTAGDYVHVNELGKRLIAAVIDSRLLN